MGKRGSNKEGKGSPPREGLSAGAFLGEEGVGM